MSQHRKEVTIMKATVLTETDVNRLVKLCQDFSVLLAGITGDTDGASAPKRTRGAKRTGPRAKRGPRQPMIECELCHKKFRHSRIAPHILAKHKAERPNPPTETAPAEPEPSAA